MKDDFEKKKANLRSVIKFPVVIDKVMGSPPIIASWNSPILQNNYISCCT